MTRISHSAKETYLQCGEKYRLHYIEKLRSPLLPSPLFLGGAFDEALNCLLLRKKPVEKHTEEDKKLFEQDPYTILDNELTTRNHNREDLYLPTYKFCKYFSKDFDPSVIEDEDFMFINSQAERLGFEELDIHTAEAFVKDCRNEIRTNKGLEEDSQVLYNVIHWCSVRRKLRYLLKCYEEEVLPQIEEVFSVQKKVELSAGEHTLVGYIDIVASFKDDGIKRVLDNKLASKKYASDAIDDAVQLATYCEHEEIDECGFIVTEKVLRKREPRHRIQILTGKISEELYEKTFDQFGEVVYNIEQGIFEKTGMDGTSQECFHFGQRCPYFYTCRGEPEKDLLVDLKDRQ